MSSPFRRKINLSYEKDGEWKIAQEDDAQGSNFVLVHPVVDRAEGRDILDGRKRSDGKDGGENQVLHGLIVPDSRPHVKRWRKKIFFRGRVDMGAECGIMGA